MEFRPSDTLARVSLVGGRDVSTDQTQQLPHPQNLEGESRNGDSFDPVKYRDCGNQMIPLNRDEARSETAPRTNVLMDADTGVDGIIPVQEERSTALDQRDVGTQTDFDGDKFWANRRVDLVLIPCMWVSCGSEGGFLWLPSSTDRTKMLIEGLQLVFGAHFNLSPSTTSSQTIICGCATSAVALALQIVNYKVLFSIRIGYYLGVAVLIKGKFYSIIQTPRHDSFSPMLFRL